MKNVCSKTNCAADISLPGGSTICFTTDGFYTSALSPQTYHPVGRPHSQFKVMPARVAIALKDKPQGFYAWGLLDVVYNFGLHYGLLRPRFTWLAIIANLCKGEPIGGHCHCSGFTFTMTNI